MKALKFISLVSLCFFFSFCSDSNDGDTNPDPDNKEVPIIDNTQGTVTFTKANNADPKLEENQDRITNKVWITRGDKGQIYNAVSESIAKQDTSPAGTEWAIGTTADLENLTFQNFRNADPDKKPKNLLGKDLVLHLIEDNLYFDIKFTTWTQQENGGGFSYTRTLFVEPVNP